MFAYVKDGTVIAVSESRLPKRKEPELVQEKEEETGKIKEYWTPAVPGLVFEEEIETDLEGELEYVDGEVRQVVKEAAEPTPEPAPVIEEQPVTE